MKMRAAALIMAIMTVTALSGCSSSNSGSETTEPVLEGTTSAGEKDPETTAVAPEKSDGGYEIALVTDLGTIDDKSFNQGAWEGVKKYAEEKGISSKYYQPQEGTNDSYLETIGLAIEGGARLVVCPGFLFEEPVFLAQDQYKDIHFILLDGEPHNSDYSEFRTEVNVMPILYQEDESGFLAGYAAVKDGNTKLGFLGGMAVPPVIRYGYGFAEGADFAAKEMGIDNIEIMYHYTGGFAATPEAQSMAASWYQNGTEVIFGCGGAVGNSAMAAAEEKGAKVIGVDVDQSYESDTVITSAMKELSVSVYDGIKAYYDNAFQGGKTSIFSAKNDGIGLPLETSKFTRFTQEDYDGIYAQLKEGKIQLIQPSEDNNNPNVDLKLEKTKINFVN